MSDVGGSLKGLGAERGAGGLTACLPLQVETLEVWHVLGQVLGQDGRGLGDLTACLVNRDEMLLIRFAIHLVHEEHAIAGVRA